MYLSSTQKPRLPTFSTEHSFSMCLFQEEAFIYQKLEIILSKSTYYYFQQ